MRLLYIYFSCFIVLLISCNNSNPAATNSAVKANTPPVHSKLNEEGTHLLMNVVNQYYALKNALVASKANRADSAAIVLSIAADSLQAFLSKDTAKPLTIKPYLDTIGAYSRALNTIQDPSCERQRLSFGTISSAIYGLLKNVDLKNAGIYRDYCPMAFNEKGAYWLSEASEIKNPYFGKKMLECGEITDSLK